MENKEKTYFTPSQHWAIKRKPSVDSDLSSVESLAQIVTIGGILIIAILFIVALYSLVVGNILIAGYCAGVAVGLIVFELIYNSIFKILAVQANYQKILVELALPELSEIISKERE